MSPKILSTVDLFGVEKIYCIQGAWMTICHAAHLSGDQLILIENIPYAITHLLKRHPRMRSRVHVDDSKHALEIFDYDEEYFQPNFFYSIVDLKEQSWENIVENECHRNPYSENGQIIYPLFQFMILRNEHLQSNDENRFHLLLFSNHCAADGRSGYIVLNDLLTLVTSSNVKEHIEPINREIIPSLTESIPRPNRILYPIMYSIGKYLFKRDLRKLHDPQIPVKTTAINGESSPHPFRSVKSKMLYTSTSTSLCARLREKCQSQQTTLHGPLFACLILAIHKYFPKKNLSKEYLKPIVVDVDFDMRTRLPKSPLKPSTVGFCVCVSAINLGKKIPLESTSFWMLAKKCLAKTNQALTNGDIPMFTHFVKDLLENEQLLNSASNHCTDGRVSEINFSNIGKYPYSCEYNQGQLRIRGLHVVNNPGIYHTSTCVWTCCAGDGQLDVSIAHEMENEDKAKEFLDFFVRLIETCANAHVDITLQQLLTNTEQF